MLPKLPEPNSLMEVVVLMVWKARVRQQISGQRALAQAALGGEKAVDAFSEYVDAVNRVDIKERSKRMHDRLEKLREVKEIRFRPLAPLQRKARTVREVPRDEVMAGRDLSVIRDFRPRSKR